jgi:hypothetical protein
LVPEQIVAAVRVAIVPYRLVLQKKQRLAGFFR